MTRPAPDESDDNGLPGRTHGILVDLSTYLLRRPRIPTLVRFSSGAGRDEFRTRILQRLGVDVERYAILNIHRIGIRAPGRHVFQELLGWDERSRCWPNSLATMRRVDGRLEHLRAVLFGDREMPFGLEPPTLFRLDAARIQRTPSNRDLDSARYVLWECGGGYPMGVFAFYVRSSIAELGEREPTQLFALLGFNFFGRESWSRTRIVNRLWESLHDRITANVLNRFRRLCEWRFRRIQQGL